MLWLTFKCYLAPDENTFRALDDSKKREERLKIIVRAMIEFWIAFGYVNPPAFVAYAFAILCLAAFRSIFYEYIDLMSLLFIICYCSINFIVNSIDFVVF